jgi:hypothetical protein
MKTLMAAIAEMEAEKYICSLDEYDPDTQLYLVSWIDSESRDWGFWASRALIEKVFQTVILN